MTEENAPERYPKRARKPVVKEFASTSYRSHKGWSQQEKELLNSALIKYGDRDLALLAAKVRSKTPLNVYNYLLMHKQAAAENSNPVTTEMLERLNNWLERIRLNKQKNPIPEPVALTMLMIALLEDHPVPTDGEVNFIEAYCYMFELLSGRHTTRWQETGNISAPTLRFIKLSTLKLLKTARIRVDEFPMKLAESDLTPELNVGRLPGPVRRLVLHKHLNPLRLNENATNVDILLEHPVDHTDAPHSETYNSESVISNSEPL